MAGDNILFLAGYLLGIVTGICAGLVIAAMVT
jgi:hypothetical protein